MTETKYVLCYTQAGDYGFTAAYELEFATDEECHQAAAVKNLRSFFVQEVVTTTKQYRVKQEFEEVKEEENNNE